MSEKPPFVTVPRCYQVSFDATIPNAHPAAMPDERQRVSLSRITTAWDALDAANQVKMECEREYREDKAKPHWKAVNAVTPYWEAEFGGVATSVTSKSEIETNLAERIAHDLNARGKKATERMVSSARQGRESESKFWEGTAAAYEAAKEAVLLVLPNRFYSQALPGGYPQDQPSHLEYGNSLILQGNRLAGVRISGVAQTWGRA